MICLSAHGNNWKPPGGYSYTANGSKGTFYRTRIA